MFITQATDIFKSLVFDLWWKKHHTYISSSQYLHNHIHKFQANERSIEDLKGYEKSRRRTHSGTTNSIRQWHLSMVFVNGICQRQSSMAFFNGICQLHDIRRRRQYESSSDQNRNQPSSKFLWQTTLNKLNLTLKWLYK